MRQKVAIITGASSGIGKSCALELAKKGAKLMLAARNLEKLQETKKACEQLGAETELQTCDVSIDADCQQLIAACVERFDTIDILINNAGISMRAAFIDLDLSVLKKSMDTNFWGMVYCTKYALPHLLKTKGSVVGVSSIAGFRGLPARTGYSASKFAMNGFLEALRTENYSTGLHVMTICPGYTESNIREAALVKDGSAQGKSPREEGKMMTSQEVALEMIKGIDKRKKVVILTFMGKITVLLNKLFNSWMDKKTYQFVKKEPDSPFK